MADKKRQVEKIEALRQHGTLNPRPEAVTDPLFQNHDFFDAQDLLQVKYEMVRQVRIEKQPVSHSAQAFGFSRPAFYQALAAFEHGGLPALMPQKRGPRQAHKLTPEALAFLEQARADEPSLRAKQLAQKVGKKFGWRIHPRTIERRFLRGQKKRR